MKKERKQTENLVAVYTHGHSKERGITLIALVVTIVVLLILAGVSINLVLGNNGIITKAKESRTETRMAQIDELVNLAIGDAYTDGIGSITDSGLKSALNNRLGEGTYDISGDETTGWKVTVKETGKTYDITANGKSDSSGESGTTVDWNKILEEANKNPESFKHEDQSETNNDIGIGTDGKPVNMDLWNASIINENEITLGAFTGCGGDRGYVGEIKDGKIQGKIPAYIKKAGYGEFYKVTSLEYTFSHYENIEIAPEIPSDVTNMSRTFCYCTNLKTVPKIPSGVTNMEMTFSRCTRIETAPEIPTSVKNMKGTFDGCESLAIAPEIPDSVTNIEYTFCNCEKIKTSSQIPTNVTSMSNTFYGCTSLEVAPKIPDGVTDMGMTFACCENLKTAPEIPDSVTNIEYTFYNCKKIKTSPKIPDNVTSMSNTFYGCTSLEVAPEIPSNVTIMSKTFCGCKNLTGTVVINATTLNHMYDTFAGTVKPIVLKGTSTYLEKLAATATNGNVTVQTTSE